MAYGGYVYMIDPKRILLVVTQAHWGGVQSFLVHFGQDLQKQGHAVLLVAAGEGALWEKAKAAGIQTHRLKKLVRELNPLADFAALKELQQIIQDFKPDAIHLNSSKIGILGSLAAQQYRKQFPQVQVAYRIGGWAFLEPIASWKKWLYLKAEQWTAKYKDTIITVHPGDEVLARKLRINPRKKIVTAANGLGLEAFQSQLLDRESARRELGLPSDAFIFGLVSNAYATKGLIPFLSSINTVLTDHPEIHICLIGDGPEFSTLKSITQASVHADRIHLVGHRADAQKLYRAFDAFLLPSKKEGMPWVLLEAMAAGLPSIAMDVGACRWMLNQGAESCGIIVEQNDQQAFQHAMKQLFTKPELRATFSQAAIQNVRSRFTWERTFETNFSTLFDQT